MNSKKLKSIMTKKKMTQYRLAKLSGISQSSINFAYHGTKIHQPSSTITAIEKALGLKKGSLI